MRTHRFALPAILLSLGAVAFAQSGAQSGGTPSAPTDAQKSFDTMKSLAGTWVGPVTLDPPDPQMSDGKTPVDVSMR